MKRTLFVLLGFCSLLASPALAQQKSAAGTPDKVLLDKVIEGWASMNTDNVKKYYDASSTLPFYDASPLKYDSWQAYEQGAKDMFATLSSLELKMHDDARVRSLGANYAVSTATVHGRLVPKSGAAMDADFRWTALWEKKPGGWQIIHDHFSAPLPEAPPK
jgi:ketosteroid isomerase-like protein